MPRNLPERASTKRVGSSELPKRSGPPLPSVTLIGCGNWGTALALHAAKIPIREIILRRPMASRSQAQLAAFIKARTTTMAAAHLAADVFWICTPDAAIPNIAAQLAMALRGKAKRRKPVVFHSSGAYSSAELARLREIGADVGSVHPLMTFPRRTRHGPASQSLTGVPFAIEGNPRACRAAKKLIHALGGEPFPLDAEKKAIYHTFGAFASPLLVAVLTATMKAGVAAGFTAAQARRCMCPIVERTTMNFFMDGPEGSFSGPIARGDAATIARHLTALRPYPQLLAAYRELTRLALAWLPSANKKVIGRVLRVAGKSTE